MQIGTSSNGLVNEDGRNKLGPYNRAAIEATRFLRACRRQQVDATPIWLMRQAGRYMAEYRALREKYGILEIIKAPELACEVTMQPINAFDLDAAIIFADILPPLEGMGLQLTFGKGEGPIIHNPIRSSADVDALRVPPPQESLWFTLEAIKQARQQLDSRNIPLIGFSGAPFTLASYAIEGGGSRNFLHAKGLMMSEPATWHRLMEKLSEVVGHYLLAQAQAGAQALQLFDSWVGALSPADYREYVLPYSRRAIEIARRGNVPIIHFSTNTSSMLDLIQEAGSIGTSTWQRHGNNLAMMWRFRAISTRSLSSHPGPNYRNAPNRYLIRPPSAPVTSSTWVMASYPARQSTTYDA